MMAEQAELAEVLLLEVPVAIHAEATEHQEGLMREFALIAGNLESTSVPPRLLDLVRRLNERYQEFSESEMQKIDQALAEGNQSVDLAFRVPPEAGEAAATLAALLAEADSYCRAGESLLTLAASERVAAYRAWFLGEFSRQLDGAEPRPWSRFWEGT